MDVDKLLEQVELYIIYPHGLNPIPRHLLERCRGQAHQLTAATSIESPTRHRRKDSDAIRGAEKT